MKTNKPMTTTSTRRYNAVLMAAEQLEADLAEARKLLTDALATKQCEYASDIHCSMVPSGTSRRVCFPCSARAFLVRTEKP